MVPERSHRSAVRLALAACMTLVLISAHAPVAQGVSSTIVISQVYGGGGNSGATLKNDFIELFNRGTTTVDLTGWTVQYASATGTSWTATALSGSIPAGGYYLVQEAQGTGGTVDLPTPDALGSGKSQITGAQGDYPVMDIQPAQDLLGICQEFFQFVVRGLRGRELDQLHLVELVLAYNPPRILAIGTRFLAKTGGIGAIVQRQVLFSEGLFPMDIGHRHLGSRDQKVIHPFDLEEVLLELGELAGARHDVPVDHEGGEYLPVAVLVDVQIEHKVDQGALQPGPEVFVQGKPGPCQLGTPLKIEDIERLADIPVGLGLKGKGR